MKNWFPWISSPHILLSDPTRCFGTLKTGTVRFLFKDRKKTLTLKCANKTDDNSDLECLAGQYLARRDVSSRVKCTCWESQKKKTKNPKNPPKQKNPARFLFTVFWFVLFCFCFVFLFFAEGPTNNAKSMKKFSSLEVSFPNEGNKTLW